MRHKLMRITTVPISLLVLLKKQLVFMSQYFDVLAVSSAGEALQQVGKEAPVRIKSLNMTRRVTPLQDLLGIFKLCRVMLAERPSIVHTHTPKAGLLGMIAAKMAGVPIRLHTVAGLPVLEKKGLLKWAMGITEMLTSACATHIYANSPNMMHMMIDLKYCAQKKIKVIGNGSTGGIDTSVFNPDLPEIVAVKTETRTALKLKDDSFVYCFIGRMVRDKGIAELVTAFCNMYQQNPQLVLLLVGPFENELDPLPVAIHKLIKEHKGIRWLDFQTDIRKYLAISDVFVFPSYREGFPNVIMQAGAMGLPCIVSNINGCNEIICDGVNGLIVPVKNIPDLEQAMARLYTTPTERVNMANSSRAIIQSRYESDLLIGQIFSEYQLQLQKYNDKN